MLIPISYKLYALYSFPPYNPKILKSYNPIYKISAAL